MLLAVMLTLVTVGGGGSGGYHWLLSTPAGFAGPLFTCTTVGQLKELFLYMNSGWKMLRRARVGHGFGWCNILRKIVLSLLLSEERVIVMTLDVWHRPH